MAPDTSRQNRPRAPSRQLATVGGKAGGRAGERKAGGGRAGGGKAGGERAGGGLERRVQGGSEEGGGRRRRRRRRVKEFT